MQGATKQCRDEVDELRNLLRKAVYIYKESVTV